MAVQQMTGMRLSLICQTISMLGFGIILGFLIKWQLALIVIFAIFIMLLLARMDIQSHTKVIQLTSAHFRHVTSVNIPLAQKFWSIFVNVLFFLHSSLLRLSIKFVL